MDTVRPRTVAAVLSPYAAGTHRDERDRSAKLEEAVGLARAIDLDVRVAETVPLRRGDPAQRHGFRHAHIEVDGAREADRLLELGRTVAFVAVRAGRIGAEHGCHRPGPDLSLIHI